MIKYILRILSIIGIGLVGMLCVVFVIGSPQLEAYQYYYWKVPQMRTLLAQLPEVTFQGIYDPQNIDEVNPYMILDVRHHGLLVLYAPTPSSFTGGGSLIVAAIGNCKYINNFAVGQNYHTVAGLQFANVANLLEHYDAVYDAAKQRDCTNMEWYPNMGR